jgi:hypothetical protein
MATRVYKFYCKAPTTNDALVRKQITLGRYYRNDLVAIERARRGAVRAVAERRVEVREAQAALQNATRSDRVTRRKVFWDLVYATFPKSKEVKEAAAAAEEALAHLPLEELADPAVALARIERLATELRKGAYELRRAEGLFWGSCITIDDAARQVRQDIPLYDRLGKPEDPSFVRWSGRVDGQISVQIQKGMTTAALLGGQDTRARLILRPSRADQDPTLRNPATGRVPRRAIVRYGEVWLRIDSEGRAPVWAVAPIQVTRAIPDAAKIKWVRLSCRTDGPYAESCAERWSCEITFEVPGVYEHPRVLAAEIAGERDGAVALLREWTEVDGAVRIGSWVDTAGKGGDLWLDADLVKYLRKSEGIRAVRDLILNDFRPRLAATLQTGVRSSGGAPAWIVAAAASIPLWRSPRRFHDLAHRWRAEKYDGMRVGYELLDAWEARDTHLWAYESGARRGGLGARRDLYRRIAADWSARYRVVVIDGQNLSIVARVPDEPGVAEQSWRQLASVAELTGCLKNAMGPDGVWKGPRASTSASSDDGDDAPSDLRPEDLLEAWRAAGEPGRARMTEKAGESRAGGAWSKRKAKKRAA